MHPVLHGDHREIGAIGLAGGRVAAGRPGRAVAAAQVVEADHEEPACVDGLARADAAVPPARPAVIGAVVAGQGMADQHGIAARGIQFAVGFIDQLVIGYFTPTGQGQRLGEVRGTGLDQPYGIFGKDRRHRPGSCRKEAAKSTAWRRVIHQAKRLHAQIAQWQARLKLEKR
ncbi:hypothetical protein D3C77_548510 [compost metagenome]